MKQAIYKASTIAYVNMGTLMLKLLTYNIHIYTYITYIQTKVDTNDTGSSPEGSTWGIQENHEKLN